jgi:hypothetical protein
MDSVRDGWRAYLPQSNRPPMGGSGDPIEEVFHRGTFLLIYIQDFFYPDSKVTTLDAAVINWITILYEFPGLDEETARSWNLLIRIPSPPTRPEAEPAAPPPDPNQLLLPFFGEETRTAAPPPAPLGVAPEFVGPPPLAGPLASTPLKGCPLTLQGEGKPAIYKGESIEAPTGAAYQVVHAICHAWPVKLRTKQLQDAAKGVGDAGRSLRILLQQSAAWRKVIATPAAHGEGYGIVP